MEPVPLDLDAEWNESQNVLAQFLNRDSLAAEYSSGATFGTVLEDVVPRHSIELIVLGTHRKHGLKKLVLGSGAEQIFRQVSCPVLTYRGRRRTAPG